MGGTIRRRSASASPEPATVCPVSAIIGPRGATVGCAMELGTLTVAAAPIGRPDDASPRLAAALGGARLIAAEDTRRLRRLAASLGVTLTARIVSYYDDV